jgi:hypothetical protein
MLVLSYVTVRYQSIDPLSAVTELKSAVGLASAVIVLDITETKIKTDKSLPEDRCNMTANEITVDVCTKTSGSLASLVKMGIT